MIGYYCFVKSITLATNPYLTFPDSSRLLVFQVERLKQQLIELEGKKEDQKEMINWVRGAESRIQVLFFITNLVSLLGGKFSRFKKS